MVGPKPSLLEPVPYISELAKIILGLIDSNGRKELWQALRSVYVTKTGEPMAEKTASYILMKLAMGNPAGREPPPLTLEGRITTYMNLARFLHCYKIDENDYRIIAIRTALDGQFQYPPSQ